MMYEFLSADVTLVLSDGRNYLQTHSKCKSFFFYKIQDISHKMGTEIFKIEEEMTGKMKQA